MPKITFDAVRSDSILLNPAQGFGNTLQHVEVRKDPLLGDTSVYNSSLKDKVKVYYGECDPKLIQELVSASAKTCLFCGDAPEKRTPQYPPELIPGGRITVGESVLFPNLWPIAKYHAVIVLSKAHFLKLSGFSPELIHDSLRAARKFVNSVYDRDSSELFVAINANYLFPAGASLVHPHLQMIITPLPYSYHKRLIEAGRTYFQENGTSYFADLAAEEEKAGSRYVGRNGNWHWLTAFSPMGSNEVMAIHEGQADFGLLADQDLGDLARGISRVLLLYESLGHLSFNYTIFSVRGPLPADGFRCLLKMVNRQNPYPNYRNDDYFLQKLLQSDLILNLPEELASLLRTHFS